MWPILVGFTLGVFAYGSVSWLRSQYRRFEDYLPDPFMPFWLRFVAIVSITSVFLIAIFFLAHIWPPLTSTFETRLQGWEWFWAIYHGTSLLSGFLGFAVGIFVTDWIIDARRPEAQNVGMRGIAIAVLAALTLTVGLDRNLDFLNRVNKLSISAVSVELEKARSGNSKTDSSAS
jgi:hypothetical protein